MNKSDQNRDGTKEAHSSENQMLGGLLRIYWVMIGNALLFLTGLTIISSKNVLFHSILFWVIMVSLLLARYLEIRYCKGHKSDSPELATIQDWKKYSKFLVIFSLVFWIGIIVYRQYA